MNAPSPFAETAAVRAQKIVVAVLLLAYTASVGLNSTISMLAKAPMLIVGVLAMAVIISALANRGWLAMALVALALGGLLGLGLGMYGSGS
jgi:hypothetical protein